MPRIISVDLGAHHVRVATWRGSRGVYALEDHLSRRVPQGEEHPPNLEARLAALDAMLEASPQVAGSGGDRVVLAFPSEHASVHRVTLPFKDPAQVAQTLPFTVEGEVPFEMEDMVMAWRSSERENGTEAMVVLVEKEKLSNWIQSLGERGFDPALVCCDAEVIGHLPTVNPSTETLEVEEVEEVEEDEEVEEVEEVEVEEIVEAPPETLMAVLDLGHGCSRLSVVRDGAVVFFRSMAIGGRTMTLAIQQAMGCTWEEAERHKHGDGQQSSGYAHLPPAARQAVDGSIGRLLADVRASLLRVEDEQAAEVERIWLMGGGTKIEELRDYFVRDLGVEVECIEEGSSDLTPEFMMAQRLADVMMNQHEGEVVDLRVGDLSYRGGTDLVRAALTYGLAGVSFFLVTIAVMSFVQWTSMDAEQEGLEERVRTQVASVLTDIAPGSLVDADMAREIMALETAEAVQRAQGLTQQLVGVPPTVDLLYDVHEAFPEPGEVSVSVSEFTVTSTMVTFNAETDGYASSSAVEEALRSVPRFSSASKGTETRMANGRVKFPITIALGVDGGEVESSDSEPNEED